MKCGRHNAGQKTLHIKCLLSLLLSVNVGTGIFVIASVVGNYNERNTQTKEPLKAQIDRVYEQVHPDAPVKEVNDASTKRSSLEFLSLNKPVVHLRGIDGDRHLRVKRSQVIRNWAEPKGSRCLLYNGPKYENGTVTIPVNGRYVVYSHVKFYVKDNNKDNSIKTFKHEVVKSSVNSLATMETVLTNHMTECREGVHKDRHLDYPSDVRGVLELNVGDQVKVKLSHPNLLTDSKDWNYFGLYMI